MNQIVPASERRRAGLGIAQTIIETAGSPQPAHVSIRSNRFTLVDEDGEKTALETLHMDVVIVGLYPSRPRQFYANKYDPASEDGEPPTCFSDDGVAPSPNGAELQSETCMACPKAKWDFISPMTGNKVPACREMYRLAVIVAGDPKEKAWRFDLKGGSFGNLTTYAKYMKQQSINDRAGDISDVLTRLEFESQGVIKFTPIAIINANLNRVFDKVLDNGEVDVVTGVAAFAPRPAQIAAPAKVAQIEAPKDMFNGGGQATQAAAQSTGKGRPKGSTNKPKETAPVQESEADALKRQIAEMQAKLDAAKAPKVDDAAPFSDKDIPDFLKKDRDPAPQQNGGGLQFGMDPNPQAPNAALQAALNDAFNMKV